MMDGILLRARPPKNTFQRQPNPIGAYWEDWATHNALKMDLSLSSLTQVIRKFAKQLDEWLKVALHDLPENLRNIKFECKY